MNERLHILHLEDDPGDVDLVQALLDAEGLGCDVVQVDTRSTFLDALERGRFDLILADYSLPDFDGMTALALARQKCPDVPFILVSGTLGEDVAVESLKNGATDYILKQHLVRFVPSVRRALAEAEEHKALRRTQEALRESEELHRVTLSSISDAVFITDDAGAFTHICPAVDLIFGWSPDQVRAFGNISKILNCDCFTPSCFDAQGEIRNVEHTIRNGRGETRRSSNTAIRGRPAALRP